MQSVACQRFEKLEKARKVFERSVREMSVLPELQNLNVGLHTRQGRKNLDAVYAYAQQTARCNHPDKVEVLKEDILVVLKIFVFTFLFLRILIYISYKTSLISKKEEKERETPFRLVEQLAESLAFIFIGGVLWYKFDVSRYFLYNFGFGGSPSPISNVSFTDLLLISLAGSTLFVIGGRGIYETLHLE